MTYVLDYHKTQGLTRTYFVNWLSQGSPLEHRLAVSVVLFL